MALTVTIDEQRPCPFFLTGKISFGDDYPSPGGESMDLSDYFDTVLGVNIEPKVGYTFSYVSGKVEAYTTAGTEVVDETDLASAGCVSIPFIAYGVPCA